MHLFLLRCVARPVYEIGQVGFDVLHDVGTEKACVFAEHGFYILNPAVVARKLIAPLGSVYAFSCNLNGAML